MRYGLTIRIIFVLLATMMLLPLLPTTLRAQQKESLRFVQLIPAASRLNIFIDDEKTDLSLAFRDASPVDSLAGTFNLKVVPEGGGIDQNIINADAQTIPGALLTLFMVGRASDANVEVVALTRVAADTALPGRAALRLLHASADAGIIDVEIELSDGAQPTFLDALFKDNSGYVDVPAGAVTIRIFPQNSNVALLTSIGTIPPDQVVTAIVTGNLADGSLGVNLLVDSDGASQSPMTLLSPIASVEQRRGSRRTTMSIVPNPASESATLRYSLPASERIHIGIYNALGEQIASIPPGSAMQGEQAITLTTSTLPPGVHHIVLTGEHGTHHGVEQLVIVR